MTPDDQDVSLSAAEAAELEEWSRQLDLLDARAVEADEAGEPRDIAAAYVALAEHVAGSVDLDTLIDLLLTAREAYLAFDVDRATEMVQTAGYVAQRGGDFDTAREAFRIACDELADSDDVAGHAAALNDFGAMSTQLGSYEEADDALTAAAYIYREIGAVDDAAEVRVNLANNHRSSGRIADAEDELRSLEEHFGSGTLKGALCQSSLAGLYAETGRPHLALPLFERSIETCQRLGDDEHAADGLMGLGWVLVAAGQGSRGDALLAEASAGFEAQGRPDKVAVCEYNRANAATYRGDFATADAAFDAAARGLTEAGLHHQLSKLQWNRVKRLTMEAAQNPDRREALTTEAVDTAIVSVITADHERFQFRDPARRAQWRESMEHRITWTFILAHRVGSPTLMADLIESTLNAGVYGIDSRADVLGAEVAESLDMSPAAASADLDADPASQAWTMGVAATLLATAELPMAPPPALTDGGGRVLLARQREIAAALDPGLAAILRDAPRVAIW